MKTNLSKYFASDSNLEADGVWIDLAEDVSFKIKRFGGKNAAKIKLLQAKYMKPYARQIEKGILDPEKERSIYIKIFSESCMVDWKGVVDENDKEISFSIDNAINLFSNLPDLFDFIVAESLNTDNYREDLGNS